MIADGAKLVIWLAKNETSYRNELTYYSVASTVDDMQTTEAFTALEEYIEGNPGSTSLARRVYNALTEADSPDKGKIFLQYPAWKSA